VGTGTSEALYTAYRWVVSVKCCDGAYKACKECQNEYLKFHISRVLSKPIIIQIRDKIRDYW